MLPKETEADPAKQTPRRGARDRVLKRGRIISDGGVFDCLVLDISPHGARVKFSIPVALPPQVMLRMSEGTTFPATRRWSRGTEVGLEFTGTVVASGDAIQSRRADDAHRALQEVNITACLGILEAERYFGDEALRRTGEAAADAVGRFVAALLPHVAAKGRKPSHEPE